MIFPVSLFSFFSGVFFKVVFEEFLKEKLFLKKDSKTFCRKE